MNVHKIEYAIPVPHPEVLADAASIWAGWERMVSATPEQRAQWAAEQKRDRTNERAAAERKPLTLDALLDKLGFTREYAEHLVQPYCDCGDTADGWDYCQHVRDEGLLT
jgi:hypothetical protein